LSSNERRRYVSYKKILNNATIYLKKIKMDEIKYEKQIVSYTKKIKDLETAINDIVTTFQNKFHANLVKHLEKCKKPEMKNEDVKNIISLKDVVKYYYNNNVAFKILNGINLDIEKGKFVVILGPSGSGKTTLLNIISGIDKASMGQVIVNEENLVNKTSRQLTAFRKNNVGYIFQQYGLLPNLTVKENVEIGANLQTNKSLTIDVDDILQQVDLYHLKDKMPAELSGGQQQRVSIARSVAKNPYILFGDEPTAAVDQNTAKSIIKIFLKINKLYRTTVILVTHNTNIADLADIVIKVDNGKLTKTYNKKKLNIDKINI
jgi:putative ABC transport system ATP-binding protein